MAICVTTGKSLRRRGLGCLPRRSTHLHTHRKRCEHSVPCAQQENASGKAHASAPEANEQTAHARVSISPHCRLFVMRAPAPSLLLSVEASTPLECIERNLLAGRAPVVMVPRLVDALEIGEAGTVGRSPQISWVVGPPKALEQRPVLWHAQVEVPC